MRPHECRSAVRCLKSSPFPFTCEQPHPDSVLKRWVSRVWERICTDPQCSRLHELLKFHGRNRLAVHGRNHRTGSCNSDERTKGREDSSDREPKQSWVLMFHNHFDSRIENIN